MKPFQIPDTDDERIQIPFSFPVNGEKIEFTVPRMDFVPPEDIKVMTWLSAELDVDKTKLAQWVDNPDEDEQVALTRAVSLIFLRPYVTDEVFEALKQARRGQLSFIGEVRTRESRLSVGEFWASADS